MANYSIYYNISRDALPGGAGYLYKGVVDNGYTYNNFCNLNATSTNLLIQDACRDSRGYLVSGSSSYRSRASYTCAYNCNAETDLCCHAISTVSSCSGTVFTNVTTTDCGTVVTITKDCATLSSQTCTTPTDESKLGCYICGYKYCKRDSDGYIYTSSASCISGYTEIGVVSGPGCP